MLTASPDARLKVYARHSACTVDDLEAVAAGARDHRPGDIREFLKLVAPHVGNDPLDKHGAVRVLRLVLAELIARESLRPIRE